MTESAKPHPPAAASGKAATGRQERLAAALRANLARRKAQQRERAAPAAEPAPKPRG
jgi:hypothetical protein